MYCGKIKQATRDIAAGEELFTRYGNAEPCSQRLLGASLDFTCCWGVIRSSAWGWAEKPILPVRSPKWQSDKARYWSRSTKGLFKSLLSLYGQPEHHENTNTGPENLGLEGERPLLLLGMKLEQVPQVCKTCMTRQLPRPLLGVGRVGGKRFQGDWILSLDSRVFSLCLKYLSFESFERVLGIHPAGKEISPGLPDEMFLSLTFASGTSETWGN